jgi:hypothetical protein
LQVSLTGGNRNDVICFRRLASIPIHQEFLVSFGTDAATYPFLVAA